MSGGDFVAVVGRRGRFLVGEPLFERGPQVALTGGSRGARPGNLQSNGERLIAHVRQDDAHTVAVAQRQRLHAEPIA